MYRFGIKLTIMFDSAELSPVCSTLNTVINNDGAWAASFAVFTRPDSRQAACPHTHQTETMQVSDFAQERCFNLKIRVLLHYRYILKITSISIYLRICLTYSININKENSSMQREFLHYLFSLIISLQLSFQQFQNQFKNKN